jgi:hypothetical protein
VTYARDYGVRESARNLICDTSCRITSRSSDFHGLGMVTGSPAGPRGARQGTAGPQATRQDASASITRRTVFSST